MSEIVKLNSKDIKEDMLRALSDSEIDGLVLVFRKNDQLGMMLSDKLGSKEERSYIMKILVNIVSFLLNR